MDKGGVSGIGYGIILVILGALGIYSLDYLNNIYTAYFLVIIGILAVVGGAYFNYKSK
jgi:amino acid transporter